MYDYVRLYQYLFKSLFSQVHISVKVTLSSFANFGVCIYSRLKKFFLCYSTEASGLLFFCCTKHLKINSFSYKENRPN